MSKSLDIGIVGLPNVGKSTLFNSLTKAGALIANYPFATIEPNVGIVQVPDKRLNNLAEIYNSKKIVPATVKFVDIAGLVKGASKGEGLGNQFLANIRSCNAIVQVVRAFSDNSVIHVDEKHDPKNDIDTINTELVLADLDTLEKRISKFTKEVRLNPKLQPIMDLYVKSLEYLNDNVPLWSTNLDLTDLQDLQLLTAKSIIYLFNLDEKDINNELIQDKLRDLVKPASTVFVCAKLEHEFSELNDEDRIELLETYELSESGLEKLIEKSYETLGLQSYLTAGEQEVRAWTIKQGSTAPQAAGEIHTDFEKGFIAAEIVSYKDLIECGSLINARSKGLARIEGKTYVVQPDDVIEFRFNN